MGLAGIHGVDVRPVTGSIIVRCHDGQMASSQLLTRIRSFLKGLHGRKTLISESDHTSFSIIRKPRGSFRLSGFYLFNALGLTLYMGYALFRRVLLKSPVPQTPLSLTGVVAIAGSIPLFWRAIADFRAGKRLGLFPFLTTASLVAVFSGEALAALEILWVLSIGMLLEETVTERARRGIRELLQVVPERAIVLVDGHELDTTTQNIRPNQTLVVYAGMKIPVDGAVLKGEALVDTAHMTGRAQPEHRGPKDEVFAGTRVVQGMLQIRADRLGEETYLARIRRLVEQSVSQPTLIEKRADRLARRLTKLGLAATGLTLVFTGSISRAFSVMLVMACPCATVLAASTAVAAALTRAARGQVLIKGGGYLEQVPAIDLICFDKTGTLTVDVPGVKTVFSRAPRRHTDGIVEMAASAEIHATHPVAAALLQEAQNRGLWPERPDHTDISIGRGVRAKMADETIIVGNAEFLESNRIGVNYFKRRAAQCRISGETVLYVARNGRLQGMIVLENAPRPGLFDLLKDLRLRGIKRLDVISGDAAPVVSSLSATHGFDHYRGDLLPEEKARFVEKLEKQGYRVMMVGDGVNDALVLSKATLGVAMRAGGSEAAIEAADIALLKSDLYDLVFVRDLAEHTLGVVEQNFWIATGTNLLGIALAASGWMSPIMTGSLHIIHSLGILMNSSRILAWKPS